jgi:hypothetical protein
MAPDPELIVTYYIAVLKIPRSIPKAIEYFKGIYEKMNADTRYSGLATKLTAFNDAIHDYDTKQAAFKQRPPAITKQVRDDAKTLADIRAKGLCGDVQQLVFDNPSYAESIITGANMFVKVITKREKQKIGVKDTNQSGTVEVLGEGEGPHEWEQREDGENWIRLDSTLTSKKTVTGLVKGKTYYFRSRQILRHGEYGPWSIPVEITAR